MLKNIYFIIPIYTLLVILSCSTPYQPKGALGGYSSTNLHDTYYRVAFHGNQHTQADTVFNFLLRRCAEITIDKGYKYFVIYEDSSYVEYNDFVDEPNSGDDLKFALRKWTGSYLFDQTIKQRTTPMDEIKDLKSKVENTHVLPFIDNRAINIVAVLKIQLFNDELEGFINYAFSAQNILDKYSK